MFNTPREGDRIMVLKWHWLQLILSQAKPVEIRGIAFRRGRYILGFKKNVYGWVEFGEPLRITSVEQWDALRHRHRVPANDLPYKKTFGLPISRVHALSEPVSFNHPKGAVGIVRFR